MCARAGARALYERAFECVRCGCYLSVRLRALTACVLVSMRVCAGTCVRACARACVRVCARGLKKKYCLTNSGSSIYSGNALICPPNTFMVPLFVPPHLPGPPCVCEGERGGRGWGRRRGGKEGAEQGREGSKGVKETGREGRGNRSRAEGNKVRQPDAH